MKPAKKKPRGIRKPKGYQKLFWSKNLKLAQTDKMSEEAEVLFWECWFLVALTKMRVDVDQSYELEKPGYSKRLMKAMRLSRKEVDECASHIGKDISARLLWAMKNQNGYFFRDLAEFCERPSPPSSSSVPTCSDPVRAWLIVRHCDFLGPFRIRADGTPQDHFFTAAQLRADMIKDGIVKEISIRYLHELCNELGIKRLPGKRGPK